MSPPARFIWLGSALGRIPKRNALRLPGTLSRKIFYFTHCAFIDVLAEFDDFIAINISK
jgi:hypothetical protein